MLIHVFQRAQHSIDEHADTNGMFLIQPLPDLSADYDYRIDEFYKSQRCERICHTFHVQIPHATVGSYCK